ncbi:MAG TPA: hypothetical protein VI959_01680 [Alphaproteobacteria bacterium]|nr:hypothetical protein [Alphaproteobacteria bacterium]
MKYAGILDLFKQARLATLFFPPQHLIAIHNLSKGLKIQEVHFLSSLEKTDALLNSRALDLLLIYTQDLSVSASDLVKRLRYPVNKEKITHVFLNENAMLPMIFFSQKEPVVKDINTPDSHIYHCQLPLNLTVIQEMLLRCASNRLNGNKNITTIEDFLADEEFAFKSP